MFVWRHPQQRAQLGPCLCVSVGDVCVCVHPAESVRAASVRRWMFQDAVTTSRWAVNQVESRSFDSPEDAEPVAEHFLVGSAHLEPGPVQVHRGNQMLDVSDSSHFDPVLKNPPLST